MLFEQRADWSISAGYVYNFAQTVSDGESTFPKIYKKILSRDTDLLFVESFSPENALVYYLFLFHYLFFFCYLFLDPPGGISKHTKGLHTLPNSPREKPPQNKLRSEIWAGHF